MYEVSYWRVTAYDWYWSIVVYGLEGCAAGAGFAHQALIPPPRSRSHELMVLIASASSETSCLVLWGYALNLELCASKNIILII